MVKASTRKGTDDAGFVEAISPFEPFSPPEYWTSEMLPEPMRVRSGHANSHPFLSYECIDALLHDRAAVIDLKEFLAMTVPGIVAHQSALAGGRSLEIPSFDT